MPKSTPSASSGLTVLALLAVFPVAMGAYQGLELPERRVPPALSDPTYASQLVAVLEEEIAHFARQERGADDHQKIVIRASVNVRIIAAELLSRGDAAGAAGSVSAFYGHRIARGRADLDQCFITAYQWIVQPASEPQGRAALMAIARFNDRAIDNAERLRSSDVERLDAAIPFVFAPLLDVVELVEGTRPVSHWPQASGETRRADPVDELGANIDRLEAAFGSATVPDVVRDEAIVIIDFLRRGARFHDLYGRIQDTLEDLAPLPDHAAFLETTSLLDEETRDAYQSALVAALAQLRDPATREDGRVQLQGVVSSLEALEAIAPLEAAGVSPDAFVEALVAIDQASAGAAPVAHDLLDLIVRRVAERQAYRRDELAPAVRTAGGRRLRQAIDAENALIRILPQLAEPGTRTDPSFIAHVRAHGEAVDDLALLSAVPAWTAAVSSIDSRHARGLEMQVKQRAAKLNDANRRDAVRRELARMGRDLARFVPMPFERELRAGAPSAGVMTGGQPRALLQVIDDTRRTWVTELARGETDGPAARRLNQLAALTTALADAAGIETIDVETIALDRWAGWEVPAEIVTRALSDVPGRLKLATAAAIDGDAAALERQLIRLERDAPFARLVIRLHRLIEAELAALPDGATGVLGQLVHPPPHDARLGDLRAEFILLCRYALEADEGWYQGRQAEAAALQAYVNMLSAEFLEGFETDRP